MDTPAQVFVFAQFSDQLDGCQGAPWLSLGRVALGSALCLPAAWSACCCPASPRWLLALGCSHLCAEAAPCWNLRFRVARALAPSVPICHLPVFCPGRLSCAIVSQGVCFLIAES